MIRLVPLALLFLLLLLGAVGPGAVGAQESPTGITVHSQYTSVAVDPSDFSDFNLDLKIINNSNKATVVNIRILSGPTGWNANVYSKFKKVEVRRVELRPGEETQDLAFGFLVPQDVPDGGYTFLVGFFDDDDRVLDEIEYRVSVGQPAVPQDRMDPGAIVRLAPRYTGLAGPKDSSFKFRVDLKNISLQDRHFGLDGEGPPGWQVSFTPAFQDTQVASLDLRAETDQALEVTVQPPGSAQPGEYTILLKATTEGSDPAVAPIKVQLTGTPKLTLGTSTGRLNARATAGEESRFTLVLVNSGTAGLDNIQLVSNAPEGWEFSFDPKTVTRLEPTGLVEITGSVVPPSRTIPGDYRVNVFATALGAQTDISLRITVGRSTSFGWIGILIVVLVIAGMGGLFLRLGRR